MRILIVEPDETLARPIERLLRRLGCEVHHIKSIVGGRTWIEPAAFDAVLVNRTVDDAIENDTEEFREALAVGHDTRIPILYLEFFVRGPLLPRNPSIPMEPHVQALLPYAESDVAALMIDYLTSQ